MANKIRVYVVEDHTIVREGIIALMETTDDLQVIGESSDGRAALKGISELKPDVVLCDLALPGLGGLEVIKRVLQSGLDTRFVVLTMYHDHAWVQRAMEAGAAGYVLKGAGVRDVVNAVRTVARGDTFLTPGTRVATSKDPLSSREVEVLTLLAEGHTSREIGQLLDISARTAEHHRAKIMKKLGINDVAGLVRYSIRNGLVDQNLK